MSDTVISHTFTFLITNMLDNFSIYSDFSMRCIRRTTRGCRLYRLSLLGCRFCRSGSSGFVGRFRLLRWSSCVPVPEVRKNLGRCRNRYICCPGEFLARSGYRPKRIRFPLRDRLKIRNYLRALQTYSLL